MTLANPIGLYGLLVLPAIVLLHLLRERRRRQVVSSTSLWSFLEEEVRGPKPRKIPITWILLLDVLIAILLSIAWAQPQVVINLPEKEAHHMILLLDVSSSMQTKDRLPSRLHQAVLDATQLINSLSNKDLATIITFGDRPTLLVDTRQTDIQKALSDLIDVKAVEIGHDIDAAFVMGLSVVDQTIPAEIHVYTDAAFSLNQPSSINNWNELAYPVYWHLYPGETNNQAVMDVEIQNTDETHSEIFTRVTNFGYVPAKRQLVLLANGEPLGSSEILIPQESSVTHMWKLDHQASVYSVALSGGDQYILDDTFTTGSIPNRQVRVAYVAEKLPPVDLAIKAIPGTKLTIFSPEEYSPQFPADLTIFRNTLPETWPEGQILIIEPPEGSNKLGFPSREASPFPISSETSLLIPKADQLFYGIDFSGIRWYQIWRLSDVPVEFSSIVQIGDDPLLLQEKRGSTEILVLLADLDHGNFSKDPAFVVLLANIINGTYQASIPLKLPLDQPIPLPESGNYQYLKISSPEGGEVEFQDSWPTSWENTFNPGAYLLEVHDKKGNVSVYPIGVNAGNLAESDLRPRDWIDDIAKNPSANTSSQTLVHERQINLMPYLLSLAIFFLILEAIQAWR